MQQSRFNHQGIQQSPQSQQSQQSVMGTYDPLKVYNNATGRQVAVTELMGAASRTSLNSQGGNGGRGGNESGYSSRGSGYSSRGMNTPRSKGGNYGLNDSYNGQAQQEMDFY